MDVLRILLSSIKPVVQRHVLFSRKVFLILTYKSELFFGASYKIEAATFKRQLKQS